MKKFLAILLTLLMVLPVFSVMVVAEAAPDQNAEPGSEAYTAWLKSEGYIAINNYDELYELRNTGNKAGKYYLAADITATKEDGNIFGSDSVFTGVFDGNGHTLYNWTDYIATTIKGTVRNLVISQYRSAEKTEEFTWNWPVLCGTLGDGAYIENVVNYGHLGYLGNLQGNFARYVNGTNVTLKNCVNYGNADAYQQNNHKVGGFVGDLTKGSVTFENCVNYGNITGSQAGGFFGTLSTGDEISATFKNCVNAGTITGLAGSSAYGVAGGFIGDTNNKGAGTTINLTFENCINTGDVLRKDGAANTKQAAQGGFIGWIKATTLNLTMTNCVVKDCKVDGTGTNNTATGGEASGLIGRLIPNSANGTISISNCTVENVVIEAYNAGRKFAFLCGNSDYPVTLVNCYANNVTYSTGKAAKLFEEVTVDGNKVMVVALSYNVAEESNVVSINKAQQSVANAEGKTAVRFIGTVNGLGFAEIGYYVELNGKAIKLTTDTVYNSLNNNYGENQITAESLNAAFLTAVVMNDVTADFNGTIKVTPFVKNLDGTYTYGKTKAISFTNGAIGECL